MPDKTHCGVAGYLLSGVIGALAATVGAFLAPVLFTVLATPILLRYYNILA